MEFNEGFSLDNIQTVGEDFDLFGNSEGPSEENEDTQTTEESQESVTENNDNPTEVDENNLFDTPESEGSEEEKPKGEEDTTSTKDDGTSPNNFYSSITKALVEEGVYTLDEDKLSSIKTAEDFIAMAKESAESQLTEMQKRVNDALNAGVEVSDIQKYERGISQLEGISEDQLTAESEEGQKIRNWVIYQDYISKGISETRAKKMLEASLKAGTDVDDAKDALESVIAHYKGEYNSLIEDAKAEEAEYQENLKKESEALRKTILEEKKVFGDVDIDKNTRQRAYDCISKPVYKDPKTGEVLTEVQKYQSENKQEFLKNVGILYALTNGFKDINKLVKSKVNKEVKRGIRELEHALNNTSRGFDGNITFASGVSGDNDSYIGKGMKLDL